MCLREIARRPGGAARWRSSRFRVLVAAEPVLRRRLRHAGAIAGTARATAASGDARDTGVNLDPGAVEGEGLTVLGADGVN